MKTYLVIALLFIGMLAMGAWRGMYDDTTIVASIDPDTTSIDVTGDSIDTMGYESIIVMAGVGDAAGTGDSLAAALYVEFELEEGSGNGVWSDVADADLTNFVAGTNDGCIAKVNTFAEMQAVYYAQYIGDKRYIRVVANATGDFTLGARISAHVIRGNAKYKPVTH